VTTAALSRRKIFFDGGCRPNPGPMEIAVVIGGQVHIERDIGHGTGMDAEWLALIHALRMAQGIGMANIVLLGDCAAVINQANGIVKAQGANLLHLNDFRALLAASPPPRIRYIKRAQNLAGIALARLHP
jgi:ribonuclease HI